MIVAEREMVFGLAVTLTVIVLSFEPDDGLTVHQLTLLDTVHDKFDEMVNVLLPLEEENEILLLSTYR